MCRKVPEEALVFLSPWLRALRDSEGPGYTCPKCGSPTEGTGICEDCRFDQLIKEAEKEGKNGGS